MDPQFFHPTDVLCQVFPAFSCHGTKTGLIFEADNYSCQASHDGLGNGFNQGSHWDVRCSQADGFSCTGLSDYCEEKERRGRLVGDSRFNKGQWSFRKG